MSFYFPALVIDAPPPKMPAIGSKWSHKPDPYDPKPYRINDYTVTNLDIEYWERDLTGQRLADFHMRWEPVTAPVATKCTCGGTTAKTTHANYCDSNPNAPAPFRMPDKLSF